MQAGRKRTKKQGPAEIVVVWDSKGMVGGTAQTALARCCWWTRRIRPTWRRCSADEPDRELRRQHRQVGRPLRAWDQHADRRRSSTAQLRRQGAATAWINRGTTGMMRTTRRRSWSGRLTAAATTMACPPSCRSSATCAATRSSAATPVATAYSSRRGAATWSACACWSRWTACRRTSATSGTALRSTTRPSAATRRSWSCCCPRARGASRTPSTASACTTPPSTTTSARCCASSAPCLGSRARSSSSCTESSTLRPHSPTLRSRSAAGTARHPRSCTRTKSCWLRARPTSVACLPRAGVAAASSCSAIIAWMQRRCAPSSLSCTRKCCRCRRRWP
mmetsp:Transcript_24902/g.86710  ORF Transcript_24902/g.86710 Transcript_24902/m.86710 type:complete len:336 (-) Transcript_24902:1352-2359(-)